MEIVLSAVDKGGEFPIQHDLNFHTTRYETKHTIVSQVAREPASGDTLIDVGLAAVGNRHSRTPSQDF